MPQTADMAALELFAYDCNRDLPAMCSAAVFKEENPLPGAELHFSIDNWHTFARPCQNHADMRRHIVAPFRAVREVIGILRHEAIEEFLQITPCGWIGVLHDNEATTGVLNENREKTSSQSCLLDDRLNIASDFVGPLASCFDGEMDGLNAHNDATVRSGTVWAIQLSAATVGAADKSRHDRTERKNELERSILFGRGGISILKACP